MTPRRAALLFVGVAMLAARRTHAHPIDAASLTLREVEQGRFTVHFQAGSAALASQIATAPAVFPKACRLSATVLDCRPSDLVGRIEFPWLEGTLTRLMVEIDWLDGGRLLRIATASASSLTVYSDGGLGALRPVVVDYTRLGVEHILTGFDHLFFVVALTLLVRRRRRLVATITAFTAAHSLTLAGTALGLVRVPAPPVEATIALSIVLVCAECLRVPLPGQAAPDSSSSLAHRAPWVVAFAFGLLHGFGFASALTDIGLPESHIPAALFCFNLGVELGQLAVIGGVYVVRALARRLRLDRAWLARGIVYAMGTTAAFWSIERVAAVFGG